MINLKRVRSLAAHSRTLPEARRKRRRGDELAELVRHLNGAAVSIVVDPDVPPQLHRVSIVIDPDVTTLLYRVLRRDLYFVTKGRAKPWDATKTAAFQELKIAMGWRSGKY